MWHPLARYRYFIRGMDPQQWRCVTYGDPAQTGRLLEASRRDELLHTQKVTVECTILAEK